MNRKKLYRSQNKMAAGVVAGVADYFDHDPTVWRLGFVCFLALTGFMPGILMYAVGYFIMPAAEEMAEVSYRVVEE